MSQTVITVGAACLCIGILIGLAIDDTVDDFFKDRSNRKAPMPKLRISRVPARVARGIVVACVIATLVFNLVAAMLLIKTRIDTSRTAERQDTFTRCVARYEQSFSEAYRARLAASTEVTNAQDRVFLSVAEQDRAAFKEALADYVALREKAKKSQVENPYPPLPDDYCGPVPEAAK